MVTMIIKGLFRRYERWNPVHPTLGAFWGMGIGIGCGIGWGPGFGPEVIGYVGAGCGIGFSVGITLAGIGIGLPANFLIALPYNALVAARTSQSNGLVSMKNISVEGWNQLGPQICGLPREANRTLSTLDWKQSFGKGIDVMEMKKIIDFRARTFLSGLGEIKDRCLQQHKDSKD
ncbi:hypothetical protein Scep_027671 [Stephania cephalantha]|uniref:Cadmium-induced protein AS8 n=1 Tax=Stephania cephalantha TaxID=152367 RepID=A0AAP0HIQ7_9MAGN